MAEEADRGGTTWQHGTGVRAVTQSEDEKSDNRSPYPGFRAPANGSIQIDAVRSVGSGFVAVCSITTAGRSRLAVWRSDDANVSSDPSTVPLPGGVWAAGTG